MRISDWSSDVCSSDLRPDFSSRLEKSGRAHWLDAEMAILADPATYELPPENAWKRLKPRRSEERRVGKEWASTCRSRGSPDHSKKTNNITHSHHTLPPNKHRPNKIISKPPKQP